MKVLELFGGIGACTAALKRLSVDCKVVDYVEIDKYAVASYNAINGMYAERLKFGGLGLYSYSNGFLHVDTRNEPYRWLQIAKAANYEGISRILPTLRQGGSSNTINSVKLLQRELGISQSGGFGDLTNAHVRKFQVKNGLHVDGVVGEKTWTSIFS